MKLGFGRGLARVFDVNIKTDYFLDNGAIIQIMTKDSAKSDFSDWTWRYSWVFSKTRFQKLLKGCFIEKIDNAASKKNSMMAYYRFTEKANDFIGEFR
jgi:hypothetical protein